MIAPTTPDLSLLQTETRNSRTTRIDEVSTLELCQLINDEDSTVALAVKACLPSIAAAIDATAPRIRSGGRLIYVGAGTSGRLGVVDASEIQPTFSAPPWQFIGIIAGGDAAIRQAQEGAEDSSRAAILDLDNLKLNPEIDTLIGIAASGRTPYVLACLEYARDLGCLTLGVACSFPSEMSDSGLVDHMISVVTGPEVVTGSTRLKAGTATKLVLNMLSTGVMVKIGKTYGNMMVDLQSSNIKLKQRSRNIIRMIDTESSGVSDTELDKIIQNCGGSIKLTLMTRMTGLSIEESARRLEASGGILKSALLSLKQNPKTPSCILQQNGTSAIQFSVCIDGGGSKCAVSVADTLGNIGRGTGGPCNFTDISLLQTKEAIKIATQQALNNYALSHPSSCATMRFPFQFDSDSKPSFKAVLAGLSGFDRPSSSESLKPMLRELFGLSDEGSLQVMTDTDLLSAVFERYPDYRTGIVAIAGTGAVAMSYQLNPKTGKFYRTGRTGGWGHILGDEGSGFDIGKQGIRATLQAIDNLRLSVGYPRSTEQPLTSFHLAVMETFGVSEALSPSIDLLSQVLRSDTGKALDLKAKIARVANVVLAYAASDSQASDIVADAASCMVKLISPFLRADRLTAAKSVLVCAGGLMKSEMYRSLITKQLAEQNINFAVLEVVDEPATAGVESLIYRQKEREGIRC